MRSPSRWRKGEVFSIIGPNGAGKTTIFNLISRIYNPTSGELVFDGQNITKVPPHEIAALGIARTFQNIELFAQATLLQNLLIGRHCHVKTNLLSQFGFLPSARDAELAHREKVEDIIAFLDLQRYRNTLIANLPYGVRKVVELGRALVRRAEAACCSTSRPPASTSKRPKAWRSGSRTSRRTSASP